MKLYSYTKSISAAIQLTQNVDSKKHLDRGVYGSLFSEHPMGYNFEITVTGSKQNKNMIKQAVQEIHDKYDHSFINEVKSFHEKNVTFEVFASEIFKQVNTSVKDPLLKIKLKMDAKTWVNISSLTNIQTTKSYKINCVHRHHNPDLSLDENKNLYGKCSAIHGHEYTIEVSLSGPLNEYGQVLNYDEFDQIVEQQLITPYHKTYLNDKMGNTSGELISELFYKDLAKALPAHLGFEILLRETRKNSFVKFA